MFVAKVKFRMSLVVRGMKIPVTRTVPESVGLQYLEVADAVQACEKHFVYIKSILFKLKDLENRAIVEECYLIWDGLNAVPSNSLSPIKMAAADWCPDVLSGDFNYTIREVQIWDVGKL